MKRLATSAVVTRQAIIKDANSLIQAVNHKTKIMLALMSEDYITQTLKNLKMELMWETVRQLPGTCLLYTSPSPRDLSTSRMPSSA